MTNLYPRAFLFDLDGTLYTSHGVIPGAPEVLATLRNEGVPFRLLTNTTMRSRAELLDHIGSMGLDVMEDELFTPSVAASAILDVYECESVAPFVAEQAMNDLGDREFVGGVSGNQFMGRPDAVVMGDVGEQWNATLLNEALRYVLDGAVLIALQKGRYWLSSDGPRLDVGPFVAAIEYATKEEAIVCGKPEAPFFNAALDSLFSDGVAREGDEPIVMVGDDMVNDVYGAQKVGIEGWLVKTGKFSEPTLQQSDVTPDRVIESVADILI